MQLSSIFNKWSETSLVLRILVGLIIGACLGLIVPQWTGISILGIVFVSGLKAIAPILVAVLVAASIAKAGGGLGPRFSVVISRYMLSTFIAAMCAVVGSFLFPVTLQLSDVVEGAAPGALTDVFTNLVTNMVSNPMLSVSQANYIGILFWAILIGIALKLKASQKTIDVVQDLSQVITQTVKWVIQFAPFGILGLVFTSVSESGLQAFFTRSSAANIPINMGLCKKLGLDEDFYSVSIPLGATINMDGAAVTITVMTLAVAHTVGVDVTFASALFLSIIATLGACGTSGVAGGSLLLIPMACSFFNIGNDIAMQAVGVGFIIGVIQDSVETALNSSGDVFFTATAEYYDRMKKGQK